jgi:hypothetical protein
MGTTCASFHLRWRGAAVDAAKAIARTYAVLGYQREKQPAEGAKRVILLARPGESFLSIFDGANADLDSGELKDAALNASRLLKTAAVFTSLYDSDSYECVLFSNGRQIDALMTDAETYEGPLKILKGKSRATQWSKAFDRVFATGQIDEAAASHSAFADDSLASLATLIGLAADRAQLHFNDVAEAPGAGVTALHFTKTAAAARSADDNGIVLRNYFDQHNSRKLLVYPGAWPMPTGKEEILTWLMLSEGAGFSGGTAEVHVTGPAGFVLTKGFLNGAKFHNGQIVGGYELPANAAAETAKAYLETKRFDLIPAAPGGDGQIYAAAYPNLVVPPMTPQSTTQIILVLQLHSEARARGEWQITVTLSPGRGDGPSHTLPQLRLAAITPAWLPVVSGLNPRALYATHDIPEPPLPDAAVDQLVQHPLLKWRFGAMTAAEARTQKLAEQAQNRPREYALWTSEVAHRQGRIPQDCRLHHPTIANSVAIIERNQQPTLDACRVAIDSWLHPMLGKQGELRLHAERQMTGTAHVGKLRKSWPLAEALRDKTWAKLFDGAQDYQAVMIGITPQGSEIPIAGMGLHATLRQRRAAPPAADGDASVTSHLLAATLGKMRGRPFAPIPPGETIHLYRWVTNHPTSLAFAGTSLAEMKQDLDTLAATRTPLQAWHGDAAWIPVFDRASDYEDTIYEEYSVLNFFRGILHAEPLGLKAQRLSAGWCANVLRMVTSHLWLGPTLTAQIDRASLSHVAAITDINGAAKIEKNPESSMEDFELALLPILPIESARVAAAR